MTTLAAVAYSVPFDELIEWLESREYSPSKVREIGFALVGAHVIMDEPEVEDHVLFTFLKDTTKK